MPPSLVCFSGTHYGNGPTTPAYTTKNMWKSVSIPTRTFDTSNSCKCERHPASTRMNLHSIALSNIVANTPNYPSASVPNSIPLRQRGANSPTNLIRITVCATPYILTCVRLSTDPLADLNQLVRHFKTLLMQYRNKHGESTEPVYCLKRCIHT